MKKNRKNPAAGPENARAAGGPRRRCGAECAALIHAIHTARPPREGGLARCGGCEWRRDGGEACLGPVCYRRALGRKGARA